MEIRDESVSEELGDDTGCSVTAISDKNIESYIIKVEEVVRIQGTELGQSLAVCEGLDEARVELAAAIPSPASLDLASDPVPLIMAHVGARK